MLILYLLSTIGLFFMAPPVYKAGVRNIQGWKDRESFWQAGVLLLAIFLLLIVALSWLFLVSVTLDSLLATFGASRPRPAFLMLWVIGIFVYGFGINFVGSLHSLALRDYKEDSFWS